MRNLAISSALICCFSGLFLITSWALAPGLGDSLIQPFAGLILIGTVIPLLVAAAAIGRAENLKREMTELEQKIRMVAAQIPPPGIHTRRPGMPQLNELVSRRDTSPPLA